MFEPFTVVIEVLELFDAALVTSKLYVTVVKFTTCCAMLSKARLRARINMSFCVHITNPKIQEECKKAGDHTLAFCPWQYERIPKNLT